jgi:hypothetical protein
MRTMQGLKALQIGKAQARAGCVLMTHSPGLSPVETATLFPIPLHRLRPPPQSAGHVQVID